MRVFTFTVIADGTSDKALIPIVEWLLTDILPIDQPFAVRLAEGLPPLRDGLSARVKYAHQMYPCDALIIHRDGEAMSWADRVAEIERAALSLNLSNWIPIVPVRMTEAWLLFDERSIRRAASNANGVMALGLPLRPRWASEVDPKAVLFSALRTASGLNGRRLERFNVHTARGRVASLISDFGVLRSLTEFQDFEKKISTAVGILLTEGVENEPG